MNHKVKNLYIHIPFCKSICTYCDFVRQIPKSQVQEDQYINLICSQINKEIKNKFKTIYIGGGTPNSLSFNNLEKLLKVCKKIRSINCEFTIEANPEFINLEQVKLFQQYKVNRISLGVQSANEKINQKFNRKHSMNDVCDAIKLLKKHNINNISLDFIYGYELMSLKDIKDDIDFVVNNKIPHVSFYSLEVKNNSIFAKQDYHENELKIEEQLAYIIKKMHDNNFIRYEVSSWCIDKKYQSKHNLCYWNTNDWKAIGLGAYGLENMNYYHYEGNIEKMCKINKIYTLKEYYFQVLMMGFRLASGLDLKNKLHKKAFNYFKHKINGNLITIKKHHVIAKNINQIDEILISII